MDIYPLRHGVSFYPFNFKLLTKRLRNLQIDIDKLVGKVLINLLHHAKSTACVIIILSMSLLLLTPIVSSLDVKVVYLNKYI